LMYGIQVDQDVNCRTFGRCVHGASIDSELGDLVLSEEQEQAGKSYERFFRYARYNADLSEKGLKLLDVALDKNKDLSAVSPVGKIPPAEVQRMDAVEQMDNLRKIGVAVAKTEVNVKKHFGSFLLSK